MNKPPINKLINDALNSWDGAGRATPQLYFFTRLQARMQPESIWDKILQIICKPATALAFLLAILFINAAVIIYNYSGTATAATEDIYSTAQDYSYSPTEINYLQNTEP